MKTAEWLTSRWLLVAGLAMILLSGWGGHILGAVRARSHESARLQARLLPTRNGTAEKSDSSRPATRTTTSNAGEIGKRLIALYSNSASPGNDFEVMAETRRLLAKMSSEEIEEFLNHFAKHYYGRTNLVILRMNVFTLWIHQDAPAALNFLGDLTMDFQLACNGFRSWTTADPAAALAWIHGSETSPFLRRNLDTLLINALPNLVKTDPDRVFSEIAGLEPDSKVRQLVFLMNECVDTPQLREKLLELAASTGRPEDLEKVRSHLLRNWGEKDPDAAAQFLTSLEITDQERQKLEAVLAESKARKDPQGALDTWMTANPATTAIPENIPKIASTWLASTWQKPDDAQKWLDQMPSGPARDAVYTECLDSLMHYERFPKVAEMAAAIVSPELRQNAFRRLDGNWSRANPGAAATWKAGLSPEDQALLRTD